MCGIVGAFGVSPESVNWAERAPQVERAIDCLAHRGPDDRACYMAALGRAFLGHRRLSIIDLAGGHQPIADESGRRRIIYNGEIYNFRALRDDLAARGHAFKTRSDGEPVLHLYDEQPDDFETRLHGMFAIAILDETSGRLTLVRDRNGIKPLYYTSDGRTLIFASELKAILALLPQRPGICQSALRDYLRWKYIPSPQTIFENVHEVPAGHRLVAEPGDRAGELKVSTRRYWEPDFTQIAAISEPQAIEELDRRVRAAVESHMESDVEVGALLSGGVDSSLVVALAAQAAKRPIKTFSVGFREPGFDQLEFARTLARHCKTDHHEEYIDLDPLTTLPQLVRQFDQPFADSSALACFEVCRVAGRHVKVVLTGDGGDETFAGYRRYRDVRDWSAHDRPWQRALYSAAVAPFAMMFSPEARFLGRWSAAHHAPLDRFITQERMCGDSLIQRLLGEKLPDTTGLDAIERARDRALAAGLEPVEAAQFMDLRTYLPGDILAKVDRTSMASSLECRVPLLDHSITEFGAALPLDLKLHGNEPKYLLKRVAERYVPRELIYRKKRGFRVPIRRWFKGDLLDRTAGELLNGTLVSREILDRRGVEWVLRNQRRSWINLSSCLWALLFMEFWARDYFAE